MKLPMLYRGDSIDEYNASTPSELQRGRKWLELLTFDGLYAKSNDGTTNKNFDKELPQLVVEYIGYVSTNNPAKVRDSQKQSYRSPLISFSESKERALHFRDKGKDKTFGTCDPHLATHFLLEFKGAEVTPTPHMSLMSEHF